MLIPIWHVHTQRIIGLCRRGPYAGFCDLPIYKNLDGDGAHEGGDVLTRPKLRARLVYDRFKGRYWTDSLDCLSHPDVERFEAY